MKKSIALIGLSAISMATSAEIYITTEKTEKSVPLWSEYQRDFYDGNGLHQKCTSTSNMDFGFCAGYISGVADVLQSQNGNSVCLPRNVVVGQVVDTVKKYLVDYPESRHYAAYSEILVALEKAFPCSNR
jgi:hypothetical protein